MDAMIWKPLMGRSYFTLVKGCPRHHYVIAETEAGAVRTACGMECEDTRAEVGERRELCSRCIQEARRSACRITKAARAVA